MNDTIVTRSPEETFEAASRFAKKLSAGVLLFLIGDLGAGKTKFVQGLADGLNVPPEVYVRSPTFALINEYRGGRLPLYHADLYRLESGAEIADIGLEEYFVRDGVTAIEWADRFLDKLPREATFIEFKILGENEREINIRIRCVN